MTKGKTKLQSNLHKSKKPKARLVKPRATDAQILDMARRYREFDVNATPADIYERRNKIHEEMANYSNPQDLDTAFRIYESKYNPTVPDGMVLVPYKPMFPEYQPKRDTLGNVIGYEPIFEPLPDDTPIDDLENEVPNLPLVNVPPAPLAINVVNSNEYTPRVTEVFESESPEDVDTVEDTILPIEGLLEELPLKYEKVGPGYTISFDDGYTPTSLNKNVYSPSLNNILNVKDIQVRPVDVVNFELPINPSYPFDNSSTLVSNKDPYGFLKPQERLYSHTGRTAVVDPLMLKVKQMEKELYDGLGIYWDKELKMWRFDSSHYNNPKFVMGEVTPISVMLNRTNKYVGDNGRPLSPSPDILFNLHEGIFNYDSLYYFYDRLLRFLLNPYFKI